VVTGSDGTYFKADFIVSIPYSPPSGSNSSYSVNFTINGLTPGANYTIYITAVDGYSKYPMRMADEYLI